jgi:hypothetical protein
MSSTTKKFEVSVTGLGMFYAVSHDKADIGLVLSIADALSSRLTYDSHALAAMDFVAMFEESGSVMRAQEFATKVGAILVGVAS